MLFRNLASILAVYLLFLVLAHCLLPIKKMYVFVALALLGVSWALADAVELAGLKTEKARDAATLGGLAAVIMMSVLSLMIRHFV